MNRPPTGPDGPGSNEPMHPPQSSEEVHSRLTASLLEADRQREEKEAARSSRYVADPTKAHDAFYRFIDHPELGRLRLSNYNDFAHVDNPGEIPTALTARPLLEAGRSLLDIQSAEGRADVPNYWILRPSDVKPDSIIGYTLNNIDLDSSHDEMVIVQYGGGQETQATTLDQAPAIQAMLGQ